MDQMATVVAEPREDALRCSLDRLDMSDPRYYQQDTWRPYFERLRREAPVHYCAQSQHGAYWSLTRYKDIMNCATDHGSFSSVGRGISFEDMPEEMERHSFILMDPPKHTERRKIVAPIIAPTNLKNMESLIRDRTGKVLDGLPRNETFDWVELVSRDLTMKMLATLFGVPLEERRKLSHWSDVASANLNAPDAPVHTEEERYAEMKEMAAYMKGLLDERGRQPPRFDLLSMLAHGEGVQEMPLSELLGTLMLLIVGGNDTTRNAMSGGLIGLNEFPDEYRKLMANPALMESAMPEIIRYSSPVIHIRRTTQSEVIVGDQRIPAGEKVILWYISGSRDEEMIEAPDRLIVDRAKPRQHLAFGAGIHRCVGDRLAELQLKILWEEILKRFPMIEVVGPPVRAYSNLLRGIRSLPVRIPG